MLLPFQPVVPFTTIAHVTIYCDSNAAIISPLVDNLRDQIEWRAHVGSILSCTLTRLRPFFNQTNQNPLLNPFKV